MSQYGHLLPTQTYIAQNKPQYVSVFDNQSGSGGSVLVSPVTIKSSEDRHEASITVSDQNADLTITAVGNINVVSEAESIVLGSNVTGGALVYVNGDSVLGRVYDSIYNQPPSYVTLPTTIYNYNVPGNFRLIAVPFGGGGDQFILNPGNYSICAYFNNIKVSTGGTVNTLDMYMVKNGTPGTIIPFSQDRIDYSKIVTGPGSFVTMQSAVFTITTTGLYNFIFATDGNTLPTAPNLWVSDNWSVQIIKWG